MKINPENWTKVKANALTDAPKNLKVKLSESGALYVVRDGQDTLIGVGTEFDVTLPNTFYKFKATKAAWYHAPNHKPHVNDEPTLANLDKRPELSKAEVNVLKAVRKMNMDHKAQMAEMRAEAKELEAMKKARVAPETEPKSEPATGDTSPDGEPVIPDEITENTPEPKGAG